MQKALLKTNLEGLGEPRRGKVRDIYNVGEDKLLIVATDRISAFDVVMKTGIPGKGIILNQLSLFWFGHLNTTPNHLITANVDEYPKELRQYRDQLEGRSMLVHKAQMVPIECVARGYITGSGLKDYNHTGEICGIKLPEGLRESDKLSTAIFTPATKEPEGQHDENISFDTMLSKVGFIKSRALKNATMRIYNTAALYALKKGIIIADTKFEFGYVNDRLVLADEVLTPDSSRFWPKAEYQPGQTQSSFDKQFMRDYLVSSGFDKNGPGVVLPEKVVTQTREKYLEAYRMLTGKTLSL